MTALLLLVALSAPLLAIQPTSDARKDARRFGLERAGAPRALDPGKAQSAVDAYNRHGGAGPLGLGSPILARPDQVAQDFLRQSAAALGFDASDLVLERQSAGSGHRHVLYRQTYRGLPVEFSRVKVHLDAEGKVSGLASGYVPIRGLDVHPTITAQDAEAVVRGDGGAPKGAPVLVVFVEPGTAIAHLAWKIAARGPQALWRYYIDAKTGKLLFRYNDLRMACGTQGTVSAMVYDIDPLTTPGPVARRLNHEKVYVFDGATFAETAHDATNGDGYYCSATTGKIFSQLQGSYINVGSFRGPGAHFDNGGAWSTVATPLSSPHPYSNDANLVLSLDISALAPSAVKFLPIFSSFGVGQLNTGGFGEGLDITDDDQLSVLDGAGFPVSSYIGSPGLPFRGAAVPGQSLKLRLKSNASGTNSGYDVSLSSYLVLTSPGVLGSTSSFVWQAAGTPSGQRSELSLFYHLNLMRDYFVNGPDASGAAALNVPVNAMALVGPGLENAFYDPDYDDLFFGDPSPATSPDAFTDDATVPHHEYTHYVVQKIWPIQNFGQAGAISEANADYFSASSLNFSSIGKFVSQAFGGSGPLRELDCPSKGTCEVLAADGSNWTGEIHTDSRYLSQALWDVRKDRITALGAVNGQACADGLVFQALLFFPESFAEFMGAMKKADAAGSVPACGAPGSASATITAKFAAHGLPLGAAAGDPYDTASSRNDGFESAVDISTLGPVSATIYPGGDFDFYTFGAGPGAVVATLQLPPAGGYFKAYTMTLYDRDHGPVAYAAPSFNGAGTDSGFCTQPDCTTTAGSVTLDYQNPSGNQFYLAVAAGPTLLGGSNSAASSLTPYVLSVDIPAPGAFASSIVSASFDNDKLSFSVRVTSFTRTQDYRFAYAQLRDQGQAALPQTLTHRVPQASDYLVLVSTMEGLGTVSGQLRIVPGFSQRFPAVGTVYVEIFGYDLAGSTVSLGLSNAVNLTTNQSSLTAWNNVFNPSKGEKATVKFELQQAGRVTLRLYTLDGAFVSTLIDGDMPAGKGSVDWDGRNHAGSTVASGVYLVHLAGPGISKTQKIAVVK